MTERQPLSNLDPAQRELAEAQERFAQSFVALVRDAASEQNAGALQADLAMVLHKTTNMIYGSTRSTIDYAMDRRKAEVQEHGAQLNELQHALREARTTLKAQTERQERLVNWLNELQHDREVMKAEIAALRGVIAEIARTPNERRT